MSCLARRSPTMRSLPPWQGALARPGSAKRKGWSWTQAYRASLSACDELLAPEVAVASAQGDSLFPTRRSTHFLGTPYGTRFTFEAGARRLGLPTRNSWTG